MKRFLMAATLALALSGTTLAGNIPTGGIEPPPPPPEEQTTSTTSSAEVSDPGYVEQISDAGLSGFLTVLTWVLA
jgi:hypothetical protein